VRPLIEALQDPHLPPNLDVEYCLRVDAALALADIGDLQATEPLIRALQTDAECRVRSYAAVALRRLRDQQAVDALIGALRDPDWLVREEAVAALGDLGDARGVGPIREVMARDKLSGVQENGRRALRELGAETAGDASRQP
jgi:HEAT repeat protein